MVPSAACALCGHPTETQSHNQCLCPALKEDRIRAHHNMAHLLWRGIEASTRGWTIAIEQTVAGNQGLQQPEDQIDAWQRAWDEVTDTTLESEEERADTDTQRKRPDTWAVGTSDTFSFLSSPGRMIGVSYPFMTLTCSRRLGTLRCETF